MKNIFCFALLLSFQIGIAQDIRIPFRVGDQFGLSDKNGQLKVAANYEKITSLDNGFYQTKNTGIDSIEAYSGKKEAKDVQISGLIFQDKVILDQQTFREYTFHLNNEFIIGLKDQFHSDQMLFNKEGKKLLETQAYQIYLNNVRYTKDLSFVNGNLTLIVTEYFLNKFSMVLYDHKQKKIVKSLFNSIDNYRPKRIIRGYNVLPFSYTDQKKSLVEKCLAYNNTSKTFEIIAPDDYLKPQYKRTPDSKPDYLYYGDEMIDVDMDVDELTDGYSSPEYKKRRPDFNLKNDTTLFFGKNQVEHRSGITYQPILRRQKNPLIYHFKQKKGIIHSDQKRTEAIHDSLFYLTSAGNFGAADDEYFFIAGNQEKDSEKMTFTILDEFGETYISEKFDRIHNFIPEIGMKYDSDKAGNTISKITIQDEKKYFSPNRKSFVIFKEFIFGFKNNKRFLINLKTKEITPMEYDTIYKNGFGKLSSYQTENRFFIFKKNEKYGFSKNIANPGKFVFPKIPHSYIPNYHQEKGFNLILLVDENGFFYYAREDGLLYYKE